MSGITSASSAIASNMSTLTEATTSASSANSGNPEKLKKAAGEFESMLLASMWKSMKESFTDPDDSNSDPASGTVNDWAIEVMSGAVGKAGGLGIGKLIIKHLGSGSEGHPAGQSASGANVFGKLADRTLQK